MSHGGVASSRASHSVAPCLAPERRIGWHRVHPDLADRVLAELAHRHAAADVVDVAQVAVVGAHDRDDRPQVRRPELRDLDRGERAVADAPHPDRAVAPRLGGQPLHGVVAVERLGLGVLVERDPARRTGPANVDPAQGVAAPGEIGPARDIRVAPPVVLAVRDHLEDRREAFGGCGPGHRTRQPQVRRQLDAVARRDPGVPDGLDLVARFARGSAVGLVGGGHTRESTRRPRRSDGADRPVRRCGDGRRGRHKRRGSTAPNPNPRPPAARGRATPGASPTRTPGSPSGTTR